MKESIKQKFRKAIGRTPPTSIAPIAQFGVQISNRFDVRDAEIRREEEDVQDLEQQIEELRQMLEARRQQVQLDRSALEVDRIFADTSMDDAGTISPPLRIGSATPHTLKAPKTPKSVTTTLNGVASAPIDIRQSQQGDFGVSFDSAMSFSEDVALGYISPMALTLNQSGLVPLEAAKVV